ncbi:DUF4233 domain-containing protein [Kitasatospora sp. NBC_01250]|uniref:DUF4233 domain-containing protein n=1 Tax=unclassified Kitasatospora TaxID=2633591 RepID=UPI002E165E44|nr:MULTISPECIES: DUF4233 domain-containing protein [unclassified Kitasatospora]WSJ69532.1 DUF4233 domain-containing protein [Kitasatospora sp. NBC_01302]
MRTLCASTLIGEVFVVLFAACVAMKMTDVSTAVIWGVSGAVMLCCVLLCGMITRRGAVAVGWALQLGLIAAGLLLPTMYALGVIFAGLWWCSVHYGRKIDVIKAEREGRTTVGATA